MQVHVSVCGAALLASPVQLVARRLPEPEVAFTATRADMEAPQLEFAELTEPMAVGSLVEVQARTAQFCKRRRRCMFCVRVD